METTVFSARSLPMKNLNGFFCRCSIEDALSSQRMPVLVAIIKCLARFPEEKIELGCVQFHGVDLQTGLRKWCILAKPGPFSPLSMALLNTPGIE